MPISIALATYNGAAWLSEQLDSLARQTVLPAELVVSDDGSTDDTLTIVRAFADRAPFPVHIAEHAGRLGFADNFLHAVAHCRSDLVAFCDQDDVWLPNKLAVGLQRITTDGSVLALHRSTLTNQALEPYGTQDQSITGDGAFDPLTLDPHAYVWGNTMLFRRELAALLPQDRRPRQPEAPDRILAHDHWIYAIASSVGRVSHIMEPLLLYRQHGAAAFGVAHSGIVQRCLALGTAPVPMLHGHAAMDERMAELFEDYAAMQDASYGRQARAAAEQFRSRRAFLDARITVFEGKSVAGRIRAYRAMRRSPLFASVSKGSHAKHLVLGLAGVHGVLAPLVGA